MLASQHRLLALVQRYAEIQRQTPYVFEGSSMGADRFGVRVI